MLSDHKKEIDCLKNKLTEIEKLMEIEDIEKKIKEREEKIKKENLWSEKESAKEFFKELNSLKNKISPYYKIKSEIEDLDFFLKNFKEEKKEIETEIEYLKKEIENLEITSLLSDKYDSNNAIFSIHAGAGGTESCDWVDILLRMYLRWAEKNKYKIEIIDQTLGEEVGTKSITLIISGNYAYGKLKVEKGIHRMVRISPFDANKRRHTTFAAVDVIPEIEDIEINIPPDELKIETFRASGAGGQYVNKTSSAVRITHIPSGIVVQCQNERSQYKNKENALKVLYSRIYQLKKIEQEEKIKKIRGEIKEIAWGNQIRSYIFHPYNLVKDHRTNLEDTNVKKVLDGEIDDFIFTYLKEVMKKCKKF